MASSRLWISNPSSREEPSVLRAPQLAAWAGLRIGIFQAVSHEARNYHGVAGGVAMILKGRTRARMRLCGGEFDFAANGDALGLFPPDTLMEHERWDCEPGAERLIVELDFSQMSAAGDLEALTRQKRSLQLALGFRDPQLSALLRLMADEVRGGSTHGELYATSLSLGLASYLFTHHARGGPAAARERGGLSRGQRECVIEYVHEHLAEKIELADLAALAGVSRFHFLRLFKNSFGVTPHRFVQDRRIEAARHLLEQTRMPLAQIATASGFSSQSHLTSAMRQATGQSPGRWRRAAQPERLST